MVTALLLDHNLESFDNYPCLGSYEIEIAIPKEKWFKNYSPYSIQIKDGKACYVEYPEILFTDAWDFMQTGDDHTIMNHTEWGVTIGKTEQIKFYLYEFYDLKQLVHFIKTHKAELHDNFEIGYTKDYADVIVIMEADDDRLYQSA